ncbi:MAG: gliding-motility protein MglA [Myxococcales bacterium]|nr:gliding-motility protein MglA [Myxococcales bacterium]
MSFINYSNREINCKIVYYGPGLGGKTTNVEYIYNNTPEQIRGKMIKLATQTERTLYFDFLPLPLGEIRGFKARFYLYTVPGQVFYYESRKLILKDVDGIVFVADSQACRMEANQASLDNLKSDLQEYQYPVDRIPIIMQYNKRDLPDIAPVGDLSRILNAWQRPEFEAVATTGVGVLETLKAVARLVLRDLQSGSSR